MTLFLFLLPQGYLCAQSSDELSSLCRKAAQEKSLEGYTAVCKYLYDNEVYPDTLLMYADSIMQISVRDKSVRAKIEYYSWSGESYFIKGDMDAGFAWKRKALALADSVDAVKSGAILCSDMGYYYNLCARYDSAQHYFRKGLAMAEGLPRDECVYLTMMTNYTSSFLFEGKTDSALVYALRAKEYSTIGNDTAMLIENLNQLGTIYRRKKDLENSIANFEQALRLYELIGNHNAVAYIYANIATVYCEWDRFVDALPFSEKAVEYALKSGNKRRIGTCYVNLGTIQTRQEETRADGIETLLKAIPILEEAGDKRQLCVVYEYLVDIYRKDGKLDAAQQYLQKLDALANELRTDSDLYQYYRAKASLLKDLKNYPEAIVYFKKLISMLEGGYKDTSDYSHYYKLSECYLAVNKPLLAYEMMKRAYDLRNSMLDAERVSQMSEYAVKYQTAEKELEIVTLRKDQLERDSHILRQRTVGSAVILILIIALLMLLYVRQRQKVKIAMLARMSSEKERQFLELQQESDKRLARKYIEGLESERERMATELHDDVCNSLLAFEMNIAPLLAESGSGDAEQLQLLGTIRERLRDISHELMPPAFQYVTLDEMLEDYVLHLSLPQGMRAEYQSTEDADWNSVPQPVSFECYRIVQEAMNNAIKYSEATCVSVALALEDNQLSILIEDDGKGFDTSKKTKGIGLRTISQRAETIGAELELNSEPGGGTLLVISIKIK